MKLTVEPFDMEHLARMLETPHTWLCISGRDLDEAQLARYLYGLSAVYVSRSSRRHRHGADRMGAGHRRPSGIRAVRSQPVGHLHGGVLGHGRGSFPVILMVVVAVLIVVPIAIGRFIAAGGEKP